MIGLRDKPMRRFGAALAALVLYVQLALSVGAPALAASDDADPLGPHALCLAAADGAAPIQPADGTPAAPAHIHGDLCCLLHLTAAAPQPATVIPVPIAYAGAAVATTRTAAFIPGPRHDPRNARAPPSLT